MSDNSPLIPFLLSALMIGIVFVIFGAVFIPIYQWHQKNKQILKDGQPAEATVISAALSGARINGRAIERLDLEVEPVGGARYRVNTQAYSTRRSSSPTYLPGARLKVMVDRSDPQQVAVAEIIAQGNATAAAAAAIFNFADGMLTNAATNATANTATNVTMQQAQVYQINGQTYTRLEDMPPEARAALQQISGIFGDTNKNGIPDMLEQQGQQPINQVFGDANQNGIPDLFEQGQSSAASSTAAPTQQGGATELSSSQLKALNQLKEMFDKQLITIQEYERKKAEILARM
ncbi:MAG: hypothetical protein Fur005_40960 [Roseiflexaceae bacterium]